MEELLETWAEEPIKKLNLLNQLIPAMIGAFDAEAASSRKVVRDVVQAVESIREVLEERDILGPTEYVAILNPEDASTQMGVSAATDKAKAATFICRRLNVLLTHICSNVSTKNVKEVIRVLMPFVQGGLAAVQESDPSEQVAWLCDKCQVLDTLFSTIVTDEALVQVLNKELFFKNLDTSLLLLTALKKQFDSVKVKTAYEMLVNTTPQLTDVGVEVLETVFLNEDDEENFDENEDYSSRVLLIRRLRQTYQEAQLKTLAKLPSKKAMIHQTLTDLPQRILPNFSQPLLLADFLLACLEEGHGLQNQVLALKGLFLLLQNHGLDCPKYYAKLYSLLQPQLIRGKAGKAGRSVSIFQMDSDTKVRFLRLLDLSLRAPTLPSKTIASFVKRLGRLLVSHGEVQTVSDAMFTIALIVNLIKRHPRCYRLLHRKHTSLSLGKRFSEDPYDAKEQDPTQTMALKSSLWELEVAMTHHYDQKVRDFAKILKTELLGKQAQLKAQEYAEADSLGLLRVDLAEIDIAKEVTQVRNNLLRRHGQFVEENKSANILGKRLGDQIDSYGSRQMLQPDDLAFQTKRARLGEKFDQFDDFFALD